jgi:RNA polymerase sigma-70 factor (ECF subfamily)
MKTDEELIEYVRSGDSVAFDVLVDRYYGACLRLAWWHLGQREDAEDAVQEALVRAYRALRRGRRPEQFRPWLFRVVLNRCRSQMLKTRRRKLLFERWWGLQQPLTPQVEPAFGASLDDDITMRPKHVLETLTPALREAFLLKHVEQLHYEEMSAITGVSVSALKMRVKRAADQVRSMLLEDRA